MSSISYKQIIDKCHKSKKKSYKFYYYHRLISLPFTKYFYIRNIQADTISISMIVLSVTSFILMIFESSQIFWYGLFLSFISFLFDKVDGDLARLYGVDSIKGSIYDFVYHRFSMFLFYLGIGIHYSYQSAYMIVLAASAGFIANYVEEMQLLSYRVFAHKFLKNNEKIILKQFYEFNEPVYIKMLKLFRIQLFLYYYFIIAILFSSVFYLTVVHFMSIALLSLIIYVVYQLYYSINYSFDNDIFLLNKRIKGVD
jgi:phosphatidylglycerophosphate synthase